MEKREMLNRMMSEGLIPVIRVTSASEAMDVADAIKEGGVSFIEITMSVQGAIDVIKDLSQKYKDEIIMGAGTILDPETGRAAPAFQAVRISVGVIAPGITTAL